MSKLAQTVKDATAPDVKTERMRVFKEINTATNQISNSLSQIQSTSRRLVTVLGQLSSNEFAAFGAVVAGVLIVVLFWYSFVKRRSLWIKPRHS